LERVIQTGIIGYGLSGRFFHAPFLKTNPGFAVTRIAARHSGFAGELFPDAGIAGDYREIIDDPDIELAVITTPNIYHFPMAKDCLLAGKHVVVEKPFVPTTAEADELIALSRKVQKHIFVYHNRRWDGDFRTVQQILRGRRLGKLLEYEAHFDRYAPLRTRATWRDDPLPASGLLYDLGPHLIDQALLLFGKPEAVFADICSQRPAGKVDDYFHLHLYYSGHKVILKAGVFVKEAGPRYILHGDNGSFVKKGIDPQEELLRKGFLPFSDDWGTDQEENHGILHFVSDGKDVRTPVPTEAGDYGHFYRNVYDVLAKDSAPAVKPEEARAVIRIIELAFESKKTKSIIPFTER